MSDFNYKIDPEEYAELITATPELENNAFYEHFSSEGIEYDVGDCVVYKQREWVVDDIRSDVKDTSEDASHTTLTLRQEYYPYKEIELEVEE